MNNKSIFQTLPLELLLPILSYVPLPECMFLRSSCRHLKTAVDEHFRSEVRTLPVVLSARYSPASIDRYEKHFKSMEKSPGENMNESDMNIRSYEKITLGSTSGVSQWKTWEKKESFPVQKKHFRRQDYLILFDLVKFDAFVDFIAKYLPNITKLALLIDHNNHLRNIHTIVDLYRKSLKVLLVDRTYRSKIVFGDVGNYLPLKFCDSVNSLEALEELYYFTKNRLELSIKNKFDEQEFLHGMFRKLRVIHISVERTPTFQSEVFENLEELGATSLLFFNQKDVNYPRLKKCFFLNDTTNVINPQDLKYLPNLEEIHFFSRNYNSEYFIGMSMMNTMNSLLNLERIYCSSITSNEYLKNSDHPELWNRTVKYIEIERLFPQNFKKSLGCHISDAWDGLRFFQGLEKVVIREPFMELTGSDLTDKNFFPRVWNLIKNRTAE